jgi:hypothetical protein
MEVSAQASAENSGPSKGGVSNLRPFQKGISGNPGGRPKAEKDIKALALKNSVYAFQKIVDLIDDEDPRVALTAAKEVLDRAYGKPKQTEDDAGKRGALTVNIVRFTDASGDKPAVQLEPPAVSVRTLGVS